MNLLVYSQKHGNIKKIVQYIRMLNLSLKEVELKAKNRGIKDLDKLLSILDKPKRQKN